MYKFARAAILASFIMPAFAGSHLFGQAVSDRILSDVQVSENGNCAVVTINFNVQISYLSRFPLDSGDQLKIRINSLSNQNIIRGRESLRAPNSAIAGIRSIALDGTDSAGPVVGIDFTSPRAFDVTVGKKSQSLVIRVANSGTLANCETSSLQKPQIIPQQPAMSSSPEGPAALPPRETPAVTAAGQFTAKGLYVLNLRSEKSHYRGEPKIPAPLSDGQLLYEVRAEEAAQIFYRLRLGFYQTKPLADAAAKKLKTVFKGVWVAHITPDEQRQALASPLALDGSDRAPVTTGTTLSPLSEADKSSVDRLMGEAETALTNGDNDLAIAVLTKLQTYPENPQSPRTQELLGLARERKNQLAHAKAEYEEYLKRYPEGPGAERVRQRLASLLTRRTSTASNDLRAPKGSIDRKQKDWTWGISGSWSQFYYRDQSSSSDTTLPPACDPTNAASQNKPAGLDCSTLRVNLNQAQSILDFTVSGGDDRRQVKIRASGSYTNQFLNRTRVDSQGVATTTALPDLQAVNVLYLEASDRETGVMARLGRQTRNNNGVLGRYDGGLASWQVQPRVKLNLVAGFPVESSRRKINTKKYFYGGNIDFGASSEAWNGSLYYFQQHANSFLDRHAVGAEIRYFDTRKNAFLLFDYDVKFKKINLALFNSTYNFADQSSLNLTLDYRESPLLTLSNGLQGQYILNPLSGFNDSILDLRQLTLPHIYNDALTGLPITNPVAYTKSQIAQMALDRTQISKTATLTYSRPITKNFQANFDATITNTGGTPASFGVDAQPAIGSEYFYSMQLIGSSLLFANDTYTSSFRFGDQNTSRSYNADFNARFVVSKDLRISPRVRYNWQRSKFNTSSSNTFEPVLRVNYYFYRRAEFELEFGGRFYHSTPSLGLPVKESGYLLNVGYRFDF